MALSLTLPFTVPTRLSCFKADFHAIRLIEGSPFKAVSTITQIHCEQGGSMFLHTRLKVRDLERSITFYTRYFNMVCRGRKTSPRGSQLAFLTMPGSPTELELAYLPWDPDFQLPEDIFHLAFRIKNMSEMIEQMRTDGVKITEEPSRRSGNGDMAFIEDPDGYEIELLSFGVGEFEALQAEIKAISMQSVTQ
jgi:lactoylglutathione lyase